MLRSIPLAILMASLLISFASARSSVSGPVAFDQKTTIEAQARCVDSPGIAIGDVEDNQVQFACLQDARVQAACNLDGQHARLKAFQQWESALVKFQQQCDQQGGHFAFASRTFQEPTDESFCNAAQPQVEYGMLENPICNFISHCPAVPVVCRMHEELPVVAETRTVALPGIPKPVFLSY